MLVAAEFGVFQVFLSMIWFFLFVLWILLVFRVFADVFRSRDLSGFAKVLWLVFIILTPFLGVFVYLIARGGKMAENEIQNAMAQEEAFKSYVRSAAGTSASPAEELARLAELRERGVIDDEEFAALKRRALS